MFQDLLLIMTYIDCRRFGSLLFWVAALASISDAIGLGMFLLMDSQYNYDAKNERRPSQNNEKFSSGGASSIIDGICYPYTFHLFLSR